MDDSTPFVLDWKNAVGLVLSVLVAFISGPGGQGGGSFYIPLFSVLLGFTTNQAAALSSATVFFGCITMVAQAVAAPHPQLPGLPVIDYTLVLAMTPSLMLGLALGVLLNAVISQWLLNLVVIAVWSWSCIQLCWTYKKARVKERAHLQRKQEQRQQQEAASSRTCADVEVVCPAEQDREDAAGPTDDALQQQQQQQQPHALAAAAKEGLGARLQKATSSWAAYQPWWRMLIIASMFGVFITAQVIRGTVTAPCSMAYWLLLGLLSAASAVGALVVSVWLLRQARGAATRAAACASVAPVDLNFKNGAMPDSDQAGAAAREHSFGAYGQVGILGSVVQYSAGRLAKINVLMVIAGLLLGTWPLSPIIMALPGMHPQVAAGTSKLMLFMITGGTGLSFIASGNINLSYMLVYGLTNAVATPLGVWVMDRVIKRSGKPSALLLLTIARLAACVVVQAAFQAVQSLIALAHGLPKAGFLPHGVCPG